MRLTKYGNKKVVYDGILFDSKKELSRYKVLKILEKNGTISDLRLQVSYELIPTIYETKFVQLKTKEVTRVAQKAVHYVADFVYKDENGNEIVEDAKGVRTKEYILKKKMMRAFLGIAIKEV
jgi:glutamine synthetase type III